MLYFIYTCANNLLNEVVSGTYREMFYKSIKSTLNGHLSSSHFALNLMLEITHT